MARGDAPDVREKWQDPVFWSEVTQLVEDGAGGRRSPG